MNTVRKELGRLLEQADHLGENTETQRAWAAEVKRLIDAFLGPGPTNVHSEAFYEFSHAEGHSEKVAILRAILLSTPSTDEVREKTPTRSGSPASRDPSRPMLFASYAREDYSAVKPILEAIRQEGVDVWLDIEALKPGDRWNDQIADALDRATGLLVFLSSVSTRSQSVRRELQAFSTARRLIIPVVLDQFLAVPPDLQLLIGGIQTVRITEADPVEIERAARVISQALTREKRRERPAASARVLNRELADSLAGDARKQATSATTTAVPPRSVFVVHGHDDTFLGEVEGYLKELGVEAVVLRRIGGAAQSLFQKFMQWGKETRFALVLLTADDLGASRVQYESDGVAERSLQFRARQNVILELGFFYGHLGWENVFVLYRSPPKVFPNFERPSDLDGVVFDHVDDSGRWKDYLRAKLDERGFAIVGKSLARRDAQRQRALDDPSQGL
ncbi:MAG: TIR domain-containing protein [Leptolyngbya sp. SIO4C1]|nr:TIR domain-containing protein [Leptolyngbya sp. SIO4C1]